MTVTERFLKYVSFHTTSDEKSETVPSAEREKALGGYIANELRAMGIENAHMDEKGYVYAYLPANDGSGEEDSLGFVAHLDTSPSAPGENIKPRIIRYEGGDIELGGGIVTSEKIFGFLGDYKGQDLIVTDGLTLLGADDKAGAAEIVSMLEYFTVNPSVLHRGIAVCFTPDEEIGRGADFFDYGAFRAKYAYTVDGGKLGEIEYENFNAAAVKVTVKGVNIHPGSAKNKMKNAVLLANDFMNLLPPAETPAHTEGYEGFYHVCDIAGDENGCVINIIIRDHCREKFEDRKDFVKKAGEYLDSVYGSGTFTVDVKDSYYNMKEKIEPFMWLVDNAREAFRSEGVEPVTVPIRGGTDGARLSYEGVPCPNLSTGGENFHGVNEFVSVQGMETMIKVLVRLACK